MTHVRDQVDALYRTESRRVLATLIRLFVCGETESIAAVTRRELRSKYRSKLPSFLPRMEAAKKP